MSNGMAFRTVGDERWIYISSQMSGYHGFCGDFLRRHLDGRGSVLYRELEEGKAVVFHKISGSVARLKVFTNSASFNSKVDDVVLTVTTLKVDGQEFRLGDIEAVKQNIWTSMVQLKDKQGKALWSTHRTALFSAHLLEALLVSLQEDLTVD